MPRLTRAQAAALTEAILVDSNEPAGMIDETAEIEAEAYDPELPANRTPLGEISQNSTGSSDQTQEVAFEPRKSTRNKGNEKRQCAGKSSKDGNPSNVENTPQPVEHSEELSRDVTEFTPSPTNVQAAKNITQVIYEEKGQHTSGRKTRSKASPSVNDQTTASPLDNTAELQIEQEPKSLIDGLGQTAEETEADTLHDQVPCRLSDTLSSDEEPIENMKSPLGLDAHLSPLPSATPNAVLSLRKDLSTQRSTSNKENIEPRGTPGEDANSAVSAQTTIYDALEQAAVQSATPSPKPNEKVSPWPKDSIVALDNLNDAIERASEDIPDVVPSPEKHQKKPSLQTSARKTKPKPKVAGPVVRTTKASQARLSIIQGTPRVPSLGKPRPSAVLGRSSSVRVAPIKKAKTCEVDTSASGERPQSSHMVMEKKPVAIPHSKPRPVSISFPTPPAPAKSTKAPTQSSFKLPGEAIAEKLKAQRDARQTKATIDVGTKRMFKARPVPSSLKVAPVVRQTNASKARESVFLTKDAKSSTLKMSVGHVRAKSATVTGTAPQPLVVSRKRSPIVDQAGAPKRYSVASTTRPSTATGDVGRSSSLTHRSVGPVKGTVKGKEVFNRATVAKERAEKERREKEEAAKRARAEAAERGRQASREWAEKQRMRKLKTQSTSNAQVAQTSEAASCD